MLFGIVFKDLIPRPITSYVRASVVQTGGQMSSFSTMDDRETPSQKAYKATGNAEKYAILIEAFFLKVQDNVIGK